jgi:hypothetical protein
VQQLKRKRPSELPKLHQGPWRHVVHERTHLGRKHRRNLDTPSSPTVADSSEDLDRGPTVLANLWALSERQIAEDIEEGMVPKGGIDSAGPFNLFSTKEFPASG